MTDKRFTYFGQDDVTPLTPRCPNCSYHNENLKLGKDKINGIPCSMCNYPLSEDDCFD